MTTEMIEGGALFAKLEDRTVSGILMPWGERSRPSPTHRDPVIFERGTIKLPRDISIVSANIQHDRFTPVARATALEETDAGLVATFSVAETDEGDDLLLQISEGRLSKLSAEFKNLVIKAGKAVSASLTGAAFVRDGAFASAALFSIATEEDTETSVDESPEEIIARLEQELADARATQTTEAAPVALEEEPVEPARSKEDDVTTIATVPDTLVAAATPSAPTIREVATALAMFSARGDRSGIDALEESAKALSTGDTGLFALSDIKLTTSGSLGVTGGLLQNQWLGNVWESRAFQRRIIPLIQHDDLKSFKVTGFTWGTPPAMAEWAGDKAAVPSNSPTATPWELSAKRYAGAHDIAREYRDFEVPEFWEAYFAAMTNSYAKLTDDAALAALVAGATAVTAGAVPSGVNSATVSLIDGALAVLPNAIPSFAVVAPDVFRSLLLQGKDDLIGTLSLSLGLEDGDLSGFKIIPHTGIAAGKALVGARNAATVFELPGSPIRTEALDQIKGGIDEALFGYAATGVNSALALALVTPAA